MIIEVKDNLYWFWLMSVLISSHSDIIANLLNVSSFVLQLVNFYDRFFC